uniref:DNA replication complex GINS protein PSF3 n=1 Tax=Amblyomma triste TaxID=251400 RepID=A0A023GJ96_AMBTT
MSSASGSRRLPCFGEYFSLDDILTTNERVPCKIEITIPKLGSLNMSSKEEDLKPGAKLDLPLWLAAPLLNRRIVSAEVPKVYRETYREILSAEAVAVDLCRLQPQYYNFGLLLQKLPLPDVEFINNSLIEAFKNRFRHIMDCAQGSIKEDLMDLTVRLDVSERTLFALGREALEDHQRWQRRQSHRIATAAMVTNHRKRKRAALTDSV